MNPTHDSQFQTLDDDHNPAPPTSGSLRGAMALAIIGGPLGYLVGALLAPAIHDSGALTIAANRAANPVANDIHVAAFMIAAFLLPVSVGGLAWLAHPAAPRLATVGGVLGVVGWLPYSALTALDDLARTMGDMPPGTDYAGLLDRFTNDPVMNGYLIVYIIGHLLTYVLLGIALRRARVVPRWASWALVASSPLTLAVFVLPTRPVALGYVALGLLAVGSLPVARAMVTRPLSRA